MADSCYNAGMEKVLILLDSITDGELRHGRLTQDSRSVKVFGYLSNVIKGLKPDTAVTLLVASPKPGKCTAVEMREHAQSIQNAISDFGPTLIVALGKASIYPIQSQLPSDFPRTLKFQKLWGRYFHLSSAGNSRRVVFGPSLSMVFAGKQQEGGYLYLRTIHEAVTSAVLRTTDGTKTVSHYISDKQSLASLKRSWFSGASLKRIIHYSTVALDTETTGLNIVTDVVRTVQLSVEDGVAYVFPFNLLTPDEWTALFEELRQNGYRPVLQNGKYDSKILRSNGVILGAFEELSVAHGLIDEREGTHNLDFIGQQILGAGKDAISKEQLVNGPIDATFIDYAGRDTDITRRAFNIILPSVSTKTVYPVLTKSQQIFADGEHKGIKLDIDRLYELDHRATQKLREYKGLFTELELNPKSPIQVKKMLGMDAKSDKKALELIDSDLARAIIDYRGLVKLKSSYLDRLRASAEIDGRFHPDIRLAGPVTGRTSSGSGSAPADMKWLPINSQNIPRQALGQEFKYVSEELRSQLRHLFIADEGRVMLGMDLAAAEMRMAANACLDPVMISDLNRKVDTHSLLTAIAYGLEKKHDFTIDLDKDPKGWISYVRPEYEFQRQSTKNATFATLYGAGLSAIAAQALCDRETAALLRRTIYGRYTGLERWIDGVHDTVRRTGRIATRYGRQRLFPYNTGVFDNQQQQGMLREAQNYVIQSEANDYCLMGMVKFAEGCPQDWGMWIQNFVHDAVYASVKEEYADDAKKWIIEAMETADELPAKMYAEAKYGQSWGSL